MAFDFFLFEFFGVARGGGGGEFFCFFAFEDFAVFECDFAVDFFETIDAFKVGVNFGDSGDKGRTGGTKGVFAVFDGELALFFTLAFLLFFEFLLLALLFFFGGFGLFLLLFFEPESIDDDDGFGEGGVKDSRAASYIVHQIEWKAGGSCFLNNSGRDSHFVVSKSKFAFDKTGLRITPD